MDTIETVLDNMRVSINWCVSSEHTRAVYEPLHGVTIVEDVVMPWNPFKPQRSWSWVDIAIEKALADRMAADTGARVRECPYCDQLNPRFYLEFTTFNAAVEFALAVGRGRWRELEEN